jgi:hypothetical protein
MPMNSVNKWLKSVIRDIDFEYSNEFTPELDPSINLDKFIKDILSVDNDVIHYQYVLPARIPIDVKLPGFIKDGFPEIIKKISNKQALLHPVIKHLLLAIALDSDEKKEEYIDLLKPFFDIDNPGFTYQSTVTWMAFLRPEWFQGNTNIVTPRVKTILPHKDKENESGITTFAYLEQNKLRINPVDFFMSAHYKRMNECVIPAELNEWNDNANKGFLCASPLNTSYWLLGFADKEWAWIYNTPGAAFFSPFYDKHELDALVNNAISLADNECYFNYASGLGDILPFNKCNIIAGYCDSAQIFKAPISLSHLLAIKNLLSSKVSPIGIPQNWINDTLSRIETNIVLDILPEYSIYHQSNLDNVTLKVNGKSKNSLDILRMIKDALDENNLWEVYVNIDRLITLIYGKQLEDPTIDIGSIGTSGLNYISHTSVKKREDKIVTYKGPDNE